MVSEVFMYWRVSMEKKLSRPNTPAHPFYLPTISGFEKIKVIATLVK